MKKSFVLPLFAVLTSACGGGGDSSGGGSVTPPSYDAYACASDARDKAESLRIYQIMTEAFIDTDGAGYGEGYGTSHHLGDLQGITAALDYIQDLGMNAIWLTPVFHSEALPGQDIWATRLDATGYFTTNYFAIDPEFGTLDDARELVDEAHARGMRVFFDGVFGHFKENAQQRSSPQGLTVSTTGSAQGDTGREAEYPDDLDFFKEVATYWITELKIDGWRLDQAYQVPVGAWGEIRRAVDEASASVTYELDGQTVHPLGYLVAEVWKGEDDIAAEAYGSSLQPGVCSAFDFPMRYRIVQTLAAEEDKAVFDRNASTLIEGFATHDAYPEHAIPNGFLTNHDLVRFGDLLQRADLAQPAEEEYWLRYQAAYAFLAAYSGPITLYYGEEIGQEVPGFDDRVSSSTCAEQGLCDDHVARTTALIDGLPSQSGEAAFELDDGTDLKIRQKQLRERIKSLMAARAESPALYAGSRQGIVTNEGEAVYVDYKVAGDDQVLFLLNVSTDERTVFINRSEIGGSVQAIDLETLEVINTVGNTLTLALDPLQARLLRVQ